MFSIFVLIPTALNTKSASRISSPFLVLTVVLTPFPDVSTLVTSAFVITLIPAFLNDFSICLDTSISSTGTMFGRYSTTVTSVPIAL